MFTSSNYIRLNHKQLNDILVQLGYSATKVNGSHIVYQHEKPDSKILVKQARANEVVHPAVIASVVTNVIYSNVADEKEIENLTQQVLHQQA